MKFHGIFTHPITQDRVEIDLVGGELPSRFRGIFVGRIFGQRKGQHPHHDEHHINVHIVRIYDHSGNEVDRPFIELKNHRKLLSEMIQDHSIHTDFCIIGAKGKKHTFGVVKYCQGREKHCWRRCLEIILGIMLGI